MGARSGRGRPGRLAYAGRGPVREAWRRVLRFGFGLLYNELAWTYDLISWVVSLGEWRGWQAAGLRFLPAGRVLELAHGPGHMLTALAAAGHDPVGLDLSRHMGQLARRRLQRVGVRAPLVRGRAEALPFADGAFDAILATFPAEFIAAPQTAEGLYRCLRPNGRAVIVPEARLTGRGILARAIELLFAITGQRTGRGGTREPGDLGEAWRPYAAAGFDVQIEVVELKKSRVLAVVATRPASPPHEKLVQSAHE